MPYVVRAAGDDAVDDAAETEVFRRLAYYVGPNSGRHAIRAVVPADADDAPTDRVAPLDVPRVENGLQPMLRTLLGSARGGTVLMENRPTVSDGRYWLVACAPLVFALSVVAVAHASGDAGAAQRGIRACVMVAKCAGLVGCLVAAFSFARGDYMRRAWMLQGCCLILLLTRDVSFRVLGVLENDALDGLFVAVANGSGVAGTWLMARVARVAGFVLPGSTMVRVSVLGACVVLSLVITGTSFVVDLIDVRAGRAATTALIVAGASDAGDALTFCFIAPLFFVALAMRGGVLRWPWGLLTLSQLCWLFYDATSGLRLLDQSRSAATQVPSEVFRALACTLMASAGVTYWLVTRPARGRASS